MTLAILSTEDEVAKQVWSKCPFCGWVYEQKPLKRKVKRVPAKNLKVPPHRNVVNGKRCRGAGLTKLLFSEQKPLMQDLQDRLFREGYNPFV